MSTVTIEIGPSADEQMSSFQNATLQNADAVAFSVATHVDVPQSVRDQGEQAVGDWLRELLSGGPEGVTFEVQVGPEDELAR